MPKCCQCGKPADMTTEFDGRDYPLCEKHLAVWHKTDHFVSPAYVSTFERYVGHLEEVQV